MPRRFAPRNDMLKTGRCARVQGRNDMQKLAGCLRLPGGAARVLPESVLATAATPQPSACHCEPVRTLAWQSASPQKCLASWHHFGQIRSHFCIRPKYCFSFCPTARRSGLPRRFAPRNDMLKTGRCARVQGRNDMQKVGRCARVQGRNDMQKFAGCLRVQRRNAVQKLAGYLHLPGGTAGAVPPRDLSPCRLGHPG